MTMGKGVSQKEELFESSKQKISAFNKPEMAVSAQSLASFGTINTQVIKCLTFLIKKIAEKAKRIKKMDLFRHICE